MAKRLADLVWDAWAGDGRQLIAFVRGLGGSVRRDDDVLVVRGPDGIVTSVDPGQDPIAAWAAIVFAVFGPLGPASPVCSAALAIVKARWQAGRRRRSFRLASMPQPRGVPRDASRETSSTTRTGRTGYTGWRTHPLTRQFDSRADVARRDLLRYNAEILAPELARFSLTPGEALAIVEIVGRPAPLATSCRLLAKRVADALPDGLAARFGIDGPALTAKLQALSPAQTVTVVDAAERWWLLPEDVLADREASLRQGSLIR